MELSSTHSHSKIRSYAAQEVDTLAEQINSVSNISCLHWLPFNFHFFHCMIDSQGEREALQVSWFKCYLVVELFFAILTNTIQLLLDGPVMRDHYLRSQPAYSVGMHISFCEWDLLSQFLPMALLLCYGTTGQI